MLGLGRDTLKELEQEDPTFPRPILLGKPPKGRKVADRMRWRKMDLLIWILQQPPAARQPDQN